MESAAGKAKGEDQLSINKEDLDNERRTRHCRKPQRCVYYAVGSNDGYNGACDYILITGHRRPCGFGTVCTVKETQGRKMRSGGMSQEVEAKVKQLYAQGYSDPSIAQAVGMTSTMIRYWRLRNELPPNANGGRPRKNQTAEAKKKAAPRAGTSEDGK